jgi:hypothetical protein
MNIVDLTLEYANQPNEVENAFWRAETWPALTEHVTGLQIHYEDGSTQVLTMEVVSKGKHAAFRSIRCKQGQRIYYFQPEPPAFLQQHYGYWEIVPAAGGTLVHSRHYFSVNDPKAVEFATDVLGWDGKGRVAECIGALLQSNSRQTMEALRNSLAEQSAIEPAMHGVEYGAVSPLTISAVDEVA